jgi:hypothetical protein
MLESQGHWTFKRRKCGLDMQFGGSWHVQGPAFGSQHSRKEEEMGFIGDSNESVC